MKIIELYKDYSIPYATDGNKHCRNGWVQCHCPICKGSNDFHMGYNLTSNYYYCWKHGWSSIPTVIARLLNVTEPEAKEIILNYGGTMSSVRRIRTETDKKGFKYPANITEPEARHIKYLEKRGFDAEKIIKQWHLKATGISSILDNTDYKHRILAPFYWDGKVVTFQARDITNKSPLKYLACPKDREIIHHKHILYGAQEFWGDTGIIVEGITDVWRLGVASAAVLGIEYTEKQVLTIKRAFKRVAVVFDGGEAQAKRKAEELVGNLKNFEVDAFRITIEGDPGGMEQNEADYLIKTILH